MHPFVPCLAPLLFADRGGERPGNVVPDWTEHPAVTFTADIPGMRLERIDRTRLQYTTKYGASSLQLRPSQIHPICTAPCAARLDPDGVYAVAGPDITRSELFVLPRSERVTVTAKGGDETLFKLGIGSLLLGGISLVPMIAVAANDETRGPAAYAALGGSVLLFAGGIALVVQGLTHVKVQDEDLRYRR